MPHRSTLLCLIATSALALVSIGCGTSSDRDQARAATQHFYAAVERHDGAIACAQLSLDLRAQLIRDESETTCAKAILKLSLQGGRPGAVLVYADTAEVRLIGGDTAFLGDTRRGWRLEAVGCHPHGDGPYECEEQA